jgi:2-polyprenyl-3-methyl-5-hydroxy-6-metoxy-1,4-benzoquinol methylase
MRSSVTSVQNKDAVARYFAAEAARFDRIYSRSNPASMQAAVDALFRTRMLRRRNEAVASLAEQGADCFELGCGSGRTALKLARRRAARVHGIDLAGPMVELARRNAAVAGLESLCRFEVADFDSFAPARRYDTFVAIGVLDYFSDPLPMLERAARDFVPEGAIVVSWPTKRMGLNLARRAFLRTHGCPVRFYGDRDIAGFAKAVGGQVVSAIRLGIPPLTRDAVARIEL